MNIRLVAYRVLEAGGSVDAAYELDLQEAPNVSLNFQFSEIKNPETRKASYSQTFKLPFSQTNNDFFQNWFNVNLETLVFSSRQKFNAILYVGTVPQFEGFLQLKGVYQKAEYYEAVLISNTADLFTLIGEKKLKDVFKNDDGSYSAELNHTYNNTNIELSWNGAVDTFVNVPDSDPLQDASAGVQKVMYPITATMENFFYTEGSNEYLAMSSIGSDAEDFMADINQLRPAVQLRTLFKLIMARAGMSYTSAFIDASYFGKLFMTTCNHLEKPVIPTNEDQTAVAQGTLYARNGSPQGGSVTLNPTFCMYPTGSTEGVYLVKAGIDESDDQNVWDTVNNVFHKISPTMTQVVIHGKLKKRNVQICGGNAGDEVPVGVAAYKWEGGVETDLLYSGVISGLTGTYLTGTGYEYTQWSHVIPLAGIPTGTEFRIKLSVPKMTQIALMGGQAFWGILGGSIVNAPLVSFAKVMCAWLAYTPGQFNGTINIPACIDPEITQRGFLKDIIERFNLVVISDPNNASNVIIEPYDDYLALGEIKDWTKKLDLSKEIIVRDTTSLQKRTINLTDLEDVDAVNKSIKEVLPSLNVYGKYYNDQTENDFAKGELKNSPVFSPYINQQIYKSQVVGDGTDLPNVVIQYEISYNDVEFGVENVLQPTKPKLFYYNGTATEVLNNVGTQVSYYLHYINPVNSTITAYGFDTYPVCTPWDITPSSGEYNLSSANKSLYWNFAPPLAPEITVFNYSEINEGWEGNSLYYLYWDNYLNNIYNEEARIMECYLSLNGIDIFNFKFNDEIFIKDAYWRILNIHNYQVGDSVSTKVTLIKIIDAMVHAQGVNYVAVGTYWNTFIIWCPTTSAACTPDVTSPDYDGLFADEASCLAFGGEPWTNYTNADGLFPCLANSGSLPAKYQSQNAPLSLMAQGQLHTTLAGKLGGRNMPLIRGVDTDKFSQKIFPYFGDDMVIKYKTKAKGIPQINGESHTMVLMGYTEGTTRGYAYPEGSSSNTKIIIPPNSNMMVRVYGISTVIGGSSATYSVGDTESFNYNTAFKRSSESVSQIGVVGGSVNWAIKDVTTTSTLHIAAESTGEIQFGLDDSETDTKKSWSLNVDIVVQRIPYLQTPYGENWALFQNADHIILENESLLIWN